MRIIQILLNDNEAGQQVLNICVAETFFTRLKGLLGTASLTDNQGMLLRNCNSVHMVGMRYALDIVYLNSEGRILKLVENLQPWRASICWAAQDTLEVKAGTISRTKWQIGEYLRWNEKERRAKS